MKYLTYVSALFIVTGFIGSVFADGACHHDCYDKNRSCKDQSQAFSSLQGCQKEQVACLMSCNSGKKMKVYRDLGDMNYSFRPVLENLM